MFSFILIQTHIKCRWSAFMHAQFYFCHCTVLCVAETEHCTIQKSLYQFYIKVWPPPPAV